MTLTFVASAALEKDGTLVAARLIRDAMRFAVMAEKEGDPSERAALERKALGLLRQAGKIEWGTA